MRGKLAAYRACSAASSKLSEPLAFRPAPRNTVKLDQPKLTATDWMPSVPQSSGVVRHLFRLLHRAVSDKQPVPWVLIENVGVLWPRLHACTWAGLATGYVGLCEDLPVCPGRGRGDDVGVAVHGIGWHGHAVGHSRHNRGLFSVMYAHACSPESPKQVEALLDRAGGAEPAVKKVKGLEGGSTLGMGSPVGNPVFTLRNWPPTFNRWWRPWKRSAMAPGPSAWYAPQVGRDWHMVMASQWRGHGIRGGPRGAHGCGREEGTPVAPLPACAKHRCTWMLHRLWRAQPPQARVHRGLHVRRRT